MFLIFSAYSFSFIIFLENKASKNKNSKLINEIILLKLEHFQFYFRQVQCGMNPIVGKYWSSIFRSSGQVKI